MWVGKLDIYYDYTLLQQNHYRRLSSLDEKEHYVLKPDDPSTSADVDQDETVHV